MLRLPRKMTMDTSKVLRLPRKLQRIFWKSRKSNCAGHTKRFSTRYKTRLNVTKCHACHAKRSNATFETSKNDPFCKTYHRHGHTAITRTVADGCRRLRTVRQCLANTPSTPRPPEWNGNPCYAFGKKGASSSRLCEIFLSSFYQFIQVWEGRLNMNPGSRQPVSTSSFPWNKAAPEPGAWSASPARCSQHGYWARAQQVQVAQAAYFRTVAQVNGLIWRICFEHSI